jgi:hypothetical protein
VRLIQQHTWEADALELLLQPRHKVVAHNEHAEGQRRVRTA